MFIYIQVKGTLIIFIQIPDSKKEPLKRLILVVLSVCDGYQVPVKSKTTLNAALSVFRCIIIP